MKVKKYIQNVPLEIIYKSVYNDPALGRARNPLSAYFNISELQSFYQILVPSLITQNDCNSLMTKMDGSYYQNAIAALKREGFILPEKYQK